jgi:hypothetical protein
VKELTKGYAPHDRVFIMTSPVLPEVSTWLDDLSGALEMESVYTVSPRILKYDKIIHDMGIVRHNGEYHKIFEGNAHNDMTLIGHVEWIKDVSSPTGALVGVRHNDLHAAMTSMQLHGEERYASFEQAAKKSGRYNVVWSHVDFTVVYTALVPSGFSNGNVSFKKGQLKIDA